MGLDYTFNFHELFSNNMADISLLIQDCSLVQQGKHGVSGAI